MATCVKTRPGRRLWQHIWREDVLGTTDQLSLEVEKHRLLWDGFMKVKGHVLWAVRDAGG